MYVLVDMGLLVPELAPPEHTGMGRYTRPSAYGIVSETGMAGVDAMRHTSHMNGHPRTIGT